MRPVVVLQVLAAALLGSAAWAAETAPSAPSGAGVGAHHSLEHDTDVDKGARPSRRLFLVDLIQPPSTQDPILTNEVDTSADGDLPNVLRVLVEDDGNDYHPRAVTGPAGPSAVDAPSEELQPPPVDQKGSSWWEPSLELEPPAEQPAIDWSKVDFRSKSESSDEGKKKSDPVLKKEDLKVPKIATELLPPLEDSYLPEKSSSNDPSKDDFLKFGEPPAQSATSAYEKKHSDSYLPEAGELTSLPKGPVDDDYLAIGEPPKESDPINFSDQKDSYFPEVQSKGGPKVDDYLAIGEPPKESEPINYGSQTASEFSPEILSGAEPKVDDYLAIGVPPKETDSLKLSDDKSSYFPREDSKDSNTDSSRTGESLTKLQENQNDTSYFPNPTNETSGSDDFAGIGTPPKNSGDEKDYWNAPVKDDFLAIGLPPPQSDVSSSTQEPHDHTHDRDHEHIHDHEGDAESDDGDESSTKTDESSDDEVDGDGIKMTESKDFRKKRHICKMCGGYGGGYSMPPISVTIVKQPTYSGGGGNYCDVCGRPMYRPPPPPPRPAYHQPCNSCNQHVYRPPPPPPPQHNVCNTCGGGGGGGGYSQSYSQSSSQSSSSSYSGGWGKK